jgi:protoporphyrinogen oxidase
VTEHSTAAIIGGGIAGLAAAYELKKAGFKPTVFETLDRVGGRVMTIRKGDFLMDLGTAVYLGTYIDSIEMIHEVGLTDEFVKVPAVLGLPRNGRMNHLDLTKIVKAGLTTRAISPRAKLKAVKLGVDLFKNRKSLGFDTYEGLATIDTETVLDYSRRVLNDELLQYITSPLVSGTWVHNADDSSVALLHWTVRNMLVSHVYNLTSGVAGLPEKLATLVDTRLGHTVHNVSDDGDSVDVTYSSATGTETTEKFDACIIATTAQPALKMYPQMDENTRALYENTRYRPLGSVVMGFSERPDDAATFALVPPQDDPDTTSFVADHHKAPGRAPEGKGLVSMLLSPAYLARNEDRDDAHLLTHSLERVEHYYGKLPGKLEEHAIVRWPESVPTIDKGRFKRIADFRNNIDHTARVQFASDLDRIPGLNGALVSGKEAAARVARVFADRARTPA